MPKLKNSAQPQRKSKHPNFLPAKRIPAQTAPWTLIPPRNGTIEHARMLDLEQAISKRIGLKPEDKILFFRDRRNTGDFYITAIRKPAKAGKGARVSRFLVKDAAVKNELRKLWQKKPKKK